MTTARSRSRGFTLVELAVVLAIVSTLLGMVLPTLEQIRNRTHLRAAAAAVETDLQFARSAAVALNRVVYVAFSQSSAGSCYVMHTGGADADCSCDAAGNPQCSGAGEVVRSALLEGRSGIRLTSNSRQIGFEPLRGMVTPTATITAESRSGDRIAVVVNIMGRVRTCTPTASLEGQPRC